ncbi:N-acetyltransferase [Enterococcus florum]|uniref:N-acetyltransferase n=1 Tax=Enterococcus florum TaxID=2480627 RepID=A0A4P5PAQ7_9ENTE|nr:GNAT family N-acetyltransferase [Enterococcus florum]GCF92582.1 N-acetyltransferase [Enterococcus florum]
MADLDLRPLEEKDVPLVETWLHKNHVKRWYEIPHMGITIDDWMTEISERNEEFSWLTYLIATWQGQPIGMCQYYRCSDSDEEDFGTLPLAGSYGIDYLIGEETYLAKGFGKKVIDQLVIRIMQLPDAQRVTADIGPNNFASRNALLSCGFTLLDAERGRYVFAK